MKKIFIIILICFSFFEITKAKFKIHGGGGAIMRAGINSYISNNNRSYLDLNSDDKKTCEGIYSKDSYLCDSSDSFTIVDKENKITEIKLDLDNTYINQYDQGSVNYYNNKVNNYNSLIKEHNNFLKEKCISVEEFCKPYECNKKYPGTIYKKDSNMCLCENGKDYNEYLGINSGNGCKNLELEKTLDNNKNDSKNEIATPSNNSNYKSQTNTNNNSDNNGGIIVIVIIIVGLWYFFTKKS